MHKDSRVFARKTVLKNGKKAIFEGLSGVPRVPSRFIAPLRSATRLRRAPPIPAVLKYATIASTGSFRKKTPRASLLAPIPAVLEYATNLNSHTCLQTGTQFANKRLSCKPAPHLQQTHLKQTSAPHANTPLANKHTSCKPAPHLQTATPHANRHSVCKQTPLMQQTHLKQTSAPHANRKNKHT